MKISSVLLAVCCFALIGCEDASRSRSSTQAVDEPVRKSSSAISQTQTQTKTLPSDETTSEPIQKQNVFEPFYVFADKGSRQNHYIPSGFMPNGKCIEFNDRWTESCFDGKTCMRIEYDIECSRKDQRWAGIYWLNPANNWGQRKGGFDLTGARKLTFWAKGDKGGEQIQEFTVGGIDGDYPDSDTAVMGPVILKKQWRQYTIDLRGKDLSYISGGFAWSTSEEVNSESCTFYLDDIRFE